VRVAVVGGTGLVGRHAVTSLGAAGHEAVVIARSTGVDVVTGEGLDEVLAGVDGVIDVINAPAADEATTVAFFGAATRNLLAGEQRAGVRHHVLLSIVGVDRIARNAHYAGKRRQEELIEAGSVPFTIVRATQFHEFAAMVVGWAREGDSAVVPPLLMQPVAAADVGRVMAEIAVGEPMAGTIELAGPETQDLVDMARRTLAAHGETVRLVPSWHGAFGVQSAGDVLLPGPDARIAPTTFDEWLTNGAAVAEES
jgi:uncharacterized protein YbjT (DUF2867 family)